ncbi:MAG: IS200/IS605 family transposase [Prosthecobacter sp.]|uniref:IS200/IS605 family transposase n=1 Tax=Prosthecobacter sp. TaxID=1965333 RepID=UPI003901062E
MAQSLAKIYIHLIFSTKNRERTIPDHLRPALHSYMGGILRDLGCAAIEINTEPDHAHVLFLLVRTAALSDVVGNLKKGVTNWLHEQDQSLRGFYWQNGYGAFSVSQSAVAEVRRYIQGQHEHHQKLTFQDEFRAFLKRYEVEFDERYVWD